MFRIGEFSKIAQVPGSLLRYYDQIGLLKPAHIDKWTGYRYYSAKQLPQLHRILALKELGLTLDQIARLVDEDISTEEIRGMLTLKKAQVEQTLHEEIVRLRHIEARLQQIDAADQPIFDLVLKNVSAQRYLSVREVLPSADIALDIMREIIYAIPARVSNEMLGHFTTIVHSETLESDRLDIELGVVLDSTDEITVTLPSERVMTIHLLPAVALMATVVRVGGFENNCQSYGAIGLWVEDNGYRIAGPGREVLIQPPQTNNLDEMVTEIQFPVEPASKALPI
jgi:DNA-binding transcriptional MerR regulator